MLPARLSLLAVAALLDAVRSGVIQVEVRNSHDGGLVFLPDNISAGLGDIVSFVFLDENGGSVNHSIVQTSYEQPCAPLEGGFASPPGNQPNGSSYNLFVFDRTQPIWFACGHPNHCQVGDVGAINAPTTGFPTLASFRAAADSVPLDDGAAFAGIPVNGTGAGVLSEGVGVMGYLPPGEDVQLMPNTLTYPYSFSTGPTPVLGSNPPFQTATAPASSGGGDSSKLGAGPIAGIVVGALAVVALLAFALWRSKLITRRRKRTSLLAHKLDVALARAEARKSIKSAYELKQPEKSTAA